MLFTPWRNEQTDLLGYCSSYQARFLLAKDLIEEQMKQYAVCSDDLNEIQAHMIGCDENEDQFDSIAPCTQSIEYQDEDEGLHDLHPDFNENYDLSEDVGIPSALTRSEPLILNELQDQDYRQSVQTLNQKQKEFFITSCISLKHQTNHFTISSLEEREWVSPISSNHYTKQH